MGHLLEARDLHVTLGATAVLRGASLTLDGGGHALVLGPSGAGKTTLLNVIGRLITPEQGALLFRGDDAASLGSPARFRRQHIGYLFQEFHLLETLTVEQNIGLVQAALGAPADAPGPRALLEPLGLGGRLGDTVSVLSRGERQRVALARAFANRPALVLADEPTSSLDPSHRALTLEHLWRLSEQSGATVLMVSHDEALLGDPHFTQRLSLQGGVLAAVEDSAY
jgi:ABC-type lipoprotein export system ATPase subunit